MRHTGRVIELIAPGIAIIVLGTISGCTRTVTVVDATPSSSPAAPSSQSPADAASLSSPASPGETASAPAPQTTELPTWANSLGGTVAVYAPGTITNGSPQETVTDFINAKSSSAPQNSCQYIQPRLQPQCQQAYQQGSGSSILYSQGSFSVGYTAIKGDEALVVITYDQLCTITADFNGCSANDDTDNEDPVYLLESGSSFDELFRSADGFKLSPTLIPCEKIDGTWYLAQAWS